MEKTQKIKGYPVEQDYGRYYASTYLGPRDRLVFANPEVDGVYIAVDADDEIQLVFEKSLYEQKYEKLSIEEEHNFITGVLDRIFNREEV